jgi:hypothetical protein
MNHRFYDPARGRFTTPDPSHRSMHLNNPLSFNRYAYANDDPVNHNDPLGLDIWETEEGGDGWYYWVSYSNGDTYQERTSDGTLYSWDDNTNGWVLTFETEETDTTQTITSVVGTADPTDPNSSNPGPTSCTTGVVWGSIVQFAGTAVGMPSAPGSDPLGDLALLAKNAGRNPVARSAAGVAAARLASGVLSRAGAARFATLVGTKAIPVIGWLATGLMIIQGGMAGYEYFENNIGSCP